MTEAKKKMYLAMKDGQYIGVFSTKEKGAETACDELIEIEPMLLDGSPSSGRYVFRAQVFWSTLTRIDGRFVNEITEEEPAWGMNPQSAAAGLPKQLQGRKGIEVSSVQLFEVDQEYDRNTLEDWENIALFRSVVRWILADGLCEKYVQTDYVGRYFEEQRVLQEQYERACSPEMDVLVNRIMHLANQDASGNAVPAICGTHAGRVREYVRNALLREFNMREMQILSAMIQDETEPIRGTASEEREELKRRYLRHVSKGVTIKRRRKLADYLDD